MKTGDLRGRQKLLRIFVEEAVHIKNKAAWRALLEEARKQELAGCTVLKGFAGFGPHHGFHSEMMLEGAGEYTMILEIVDSLTKTDAFLKSAKEMISEAVFFREDVIVRHYDHKQNGEMINQMEAAVATTDLNGEQTLLRIMLGESDKSGHNSLHYEILAKAKKSGIAGATVSRGIAGFGASSVIHEPHLFKLSSDLPVVIEIIDSKKKIDEFMLLIEPLLKGALVTEEVVEVLHYKPK